MTEENRGARWEINRRTTETRMVQNGEVGAFLEKSHFPPQFCLALVQDLLSKVYAIFKPLIYLSLQKKKKKISGLICLTDLRLKTKWSILWGLTLRVERVVVPFLLTDLSLWVPLAGLMSAPTTRGHCSLCFLGSSNFCPKSAGRGNWGESGRAQSAGKVGGLRVEKSQERRRRLHRWLLSRLQEKPHWPPPPQQSPGCQVGTSLHPGSVDGVHRLDLQLHSLDRELYFLPLKVGQGKAGQTHFFAPLQPRGLLSCQPATLL